MHQSLFYLRASALALACLVGVACAADTSSTEAGAGDVDKLDSEDRLPFEGADFVNPPTLLTFGPSSKPVPLVVPEDSDVLGDVLLSQSFEVDYDGAFDALWASVDLEHNSLDDLEVRVLLPADKDGNRAEVMVKDWRAAPAWPARTTVFKRDMIKINLSFFGNGGHASASPRVAPGTWTLELIDHGFDAGEVGEFRSFSVSLGSFGHNTYANLNSVWFTSDENGWDGPNVEQNESDIEVPYGVSDTLTIEGEFSDCSPRIKTPSGKVIDLSDRMTINDAGKSVLVGYQHEPWLSGGTYTLISTCGIMGWWIHVAD